MQAPGPDWQNGADFGHWSLLVQPQRFPLPEEQKPLQH
jgi:hypothetical protein